MISQCSNFQLFRCSAFTSQPSFYRHTYYNYSIIFYIVTYYLIEDIHLFSTLIDNSFIAYFYPVSSFWHAVRIPQTLKLNLNPCFSLESIALNCKHAFSSKYTRSSTVDKMINKKRIWSYFQITRAAWPSTFMYGLLNFNKHAKLYQKQVSSAHYCRANFILAVNRSVFTVKSSILINKENSYW